MVNMILLLSPHQENLFKDILYAIPHTQKRIGVDKWHQVLGELISMGITLPVSRGLLNQIQENLRHVQGKRVMLTNCIHQVLEDF